MPAQSKYKDIRKKLAGAQKNVKNLIKLMREISKAQKPLWQKVPYLALQADGRTGYLDLYILAYRQGYWAIESGNIGAPYKVFVNLETGELVDAMDPRKPASDANILDFAIDIKQIDANLIIQTLLAKIAQPTDPRFYNQKKRARWQEKMIKICGLSPNSYKQDMGTAEKIYVENFIADFMRKESRLRLP